MYEYFQYFLMWAHMQLITNEILDHILHPLFTSLIGTPYIFANFARFTRVYPDSELIDLRHSHFFVEEHH